MNNQYVDVLEAIYQACKEIPGWLDNLKPYHDLDDIEYFERLINIEKTVGKIEA